MIWTADPASLTDPAGQRVACVDALARFFQRAAPGDELHLASGDYRRQTLAPSRRPKLAESVAIIGPTNGQPTAVLRRDDTVGSTDALLLKAGVRDLVLDGLDLEVDDRAALKTEGAGARHVTLRGVRLLGRGAGPTDPTWTDVGKWGAHHYAVGNWTEEACRVERVYQEHAAYHHQIAGNLTLLYGTTRHCGRTRLQIVNRRAENGVPTSGPGRGDVLVQDDAVEDVCLEQGGGGSAYTFRGGMPESTVRLVRCIVRLGCDAALAAPFNANVTGALLVDSSPESRPGAGDDAWPGGTAEVQLVDCDFEAGTVYPGMGSAFRPLVSIDAVDRCIIDGGRFVRHGGRGQIPIAFDIKAGCPQLVVVRPPTEVVGEVMYHGARYSTWSQFAAAHPEVFA